MSWGGSGNALININQLDPKYQTLVADTTKSAPNPFFGVAAAGPYATQANLSIGQLLRPYPAVRQRLHAAVDRRALAVSRRHLPDPQARHRPVGRQLQLHLQPPERQPVRREQLLLERARPAEQLHRDSRVAVLQPGSGVRPQPARLAAQGRHRADAAAAVRRGPSARIQRRRQRPARRLVDHAGDHAAERLPDRRQPEPADAVVPLRQHASVRTSSRARTSWSPATSPIGSPPTRPTISI